LIELDKLFSKIDFEFEKLIKFIKSYYYSLDQFKMNETQTLVPNLVYLLDDRVFMFYKSIFFVKKIQSIYNMFNICEQYNIFFYSIYLLQFLYINNLDLKKVKFLSIFIKYNN
jgi:hypothetical protein